jgi:hypothetical protein
MVLWKKDPIEVVSKWIALSVLRPPAKCYKSIASGIPKFGPEELSSV